MALLSPFLPLQMFRPLSGRVPSRPAWPQRWVDRCIALGWAALAFVQPVWAQTPDHPLRLRGTDMLTDRLPPQAARDAPSFVWGDRVSGQSGVRTVVEGHAELRRHDTVLKADRLELLHQTNDAQASGNVSIVRQGNRYQGPLLQINLDTYEGFFSQPRYRLLATQGGGQASRVDFRGEKLSIAHDATYSTCPAPEQGQPDWWVKADRLELDTATDTGRASGGALYFKGVPILAAPSISFPLSDKRKSGLLPPTINLSNRSGLELSLPYYWNIAPEMDATFTPTLLTKRGLDLGAEFRYLQPTFKGETRVSVLPSDRVRGSTRWSEAFRHDHALGTALPGLADAALRVNLNRVSDDDYWKDLPRTMPLLTQRLLPNEVALSGRVKAVGLTAGVYTWQTLQDPTAPITAPYDRTPQVDLRWEQFNQTLGGLGGLDWSLTGQATRFTTSRTPTISATGADVNGNRLLGIAQVSRLWQAPGWFVKPKFQWHLTHYQVDQPLTNGLRTANRVVPTFSVDSGLVFERDARWGGRDWVQTLEPRAFYVRTPYRDQQALPNYDSGAKDFNAGTAWVENAFGGHDRIADTHALTLGVGSRLIDPASGVEAVRATLAQRFRFANQNVTLPGGSPVTDRWSDVLLSTSINWVPSWSFDGSVQFNPQSGRSQRTTLSGRYHPRPYHSLGAAYRLQRAGGLLPASEQVDVGWQWPLSSLADSVQPLTSRGRTAPGRCAGQWYSVGRVNYSMPDRKVVDLVAGLEYDAGCWIGRFVLERLQTGTSSASQRVLFQLEFNGFTRIGANPLQTLRNNVPRYMLLNEQVQTPSRFGSYE